MAQHPTKPDSMSDARLQHLAGEASLRRGRDYVRRGLVLRATVRADGTVDGVVEGESIYRVRVGASSWSCDCPVGVSGSFCKHCVAVTLAARDSARDPAPTTPGAAEPAAGASPPLPLIEWQPQILAAFRTRRDLWRWQAVSQYASEAYAGVEELRRAAAAHGAARVIPITQKALASAVRVLERADDSNGEIQTVIGDMLQLHSELCAIAPPPAAKLVDWLIAFQFDGSQDYVELDVADYAVALGDTGLRRFRERLDAIEQRLEPIAEPFDSIRLRLEHNRQRLAVALRDIPGVVASFGELARSYEMHDLAKVLAEVGATELAVEWAERAALLEPGWQAERAGQYWCELLREHRPGEELAARRTMFSRWPTSQNALRLAEAAGTLWGDHAEYVYAELEARDPRALIETLLGRRENERAWQTAQRFPLGADLWSRLVDVRQDADPGSVVPVLRELIDADLEVSDARNYRSAVKRLKQLKRALDRAGRGGEFETIVEHLRYEHRRRPRFLEELRRARF